MKVQLLIAALEQNPEELIQKMHIDSDAVLINQCNQDSQEIYQKGKWNIEVINCAERGVGKSRNKAIEWASGDILVFADDDMVYEDNYGAKIAAEFENNKKAEMIIFNVSIEENRKTFENTERKRIHWYNSGRYGAVSFAIKRESLKKYGVFYSLYFGGGAEFGNGEDSLFLLELIKKGCKVYTSPVTIGREAKRESGKESTWFKGYDNKFFFDRGVLYSFMYGRLAYPLALRFLLAHKEKMCQTVTFKEALGQMKAGIKRGDKLR